MYNKSSSSSSSFKKLFKVKDLVEIEKILGVKITRNRSKRTIRMD